MWQHYVVGYFIITFAASEREIVKRIDPVKLFIILGDNMMYFQVLRPITILAFVMISSSDFGTN